MLKSDYVKSRTIQLPIYPYEVHFFILTKENYKFLGKSYARTEREGKDIFVYMKQNIEIDIVAHEIFHCVEFIMDGIGQKYGEVPNESWAYLMQFIMNQYRIFKSRKYGE